LLTVFSVFLTVGAFAQEIQRLSAQYKNFDGTETLSNTAAAATGAGGVRVYSKSVFVPFLSGGQVMYVTISAVGDNHFGESNFVSCNIDGPGGSGTVATVCNPTPFTTGIDLAPPGWVGMTHHFQYDTVMGCAGCIVQYTSNGVPGITSGDGGGGQGDEHDNDYYYTWCKPIGAGSHTVNLRLGNKTGIAADTVFFEKAFIFIDVSANPPFGACTKSSL
jgi:hypothetical protein